MDTGGFEQVLWRDHRRLRVVAVLTLTALISTALIFAFGFSLAVDAAAKKQSCPTLTLSAPLHFGEGVVGK